MDSKDVIVEKLVVLGGSGDTKDKDLFENIISNLQMDAFNRKMYSGEIKLKDYWDE